MFKVSLKGKYAERNKTKGTSRVTIGYLPDYYRHIWTIVSRYGAMRLTYINKIQVLLNRVARIICDNLDWNVSSSALVKSLGWFIVKEKRNIL